MLADLLVSTPKPIVPPRIFCKAAAQKHLEIALLRDKDPLKILKQFKSRILKKQLPPPLKMDENLRKLALDCAYSIDLSKLTQLHK